MDRPRRVRKVRSRRRCRRELPDGMVMSPVYHGEPDAVTEAVLADPGLSAADEIVLFLPPAFGLDDNVTLLTDLAQLVAPALGWIPAH